MHNVYSYYYYVYSSIDVLLPEEVLVVEVSYYNSITVLVEYML